ncbi:MAG: transposase [Gemmatimonadota bacterium]|nr:transposase [Gemmatimonadota bacterium]
MYSKSGLLALSLAFVLTTACKSKEEKAAEEAAKQMEVAAKQMQEAAKTGTANMGDAMAAMGAAMSGAANAGKKVETVNYQELKALLPESLPGMKRTNATGEKSSAMGMQISHAEGRYSSDDGNSSTIKITDIGSMTGLAGMTAYAWAKVDVDRESDTGYEKTTTHGGYKAHEKYDTQNKSGEISVLVGDRFVVEVDGRGIDMDAIKSTLGKVDLGKLNSMKGQGVQ